MGSLDHVGFAAVEEGIGERIFLLVFSEEIRVGVGDADQFHIAVLRQGGKKSFDVTVLEANNGYAQRAWLGLAGLGYQRGGHRQQQSAQKEGRYEARWRIETKTQAQHDL